MGVSRERWNKANKSEKLRILKIYYPELISKILMEARLKETKESKKITDADSFLEFLKRN
jgi:hypothetical protein